MESTSDTPVRVTTARTEVEAAAIAAALNDRGIHAEVSGGIASSFRAEAPRTVDILVRAGDLERATAELEHIRAEFKDIDWSAVDVGEAEEDVQQ